VPVKVGTSKEQSSKSERRCWFPPASRSQDVALIRTVFVAVASSRCTQKRLGRNEHHRRKEHEVTNDRSQKYSSGCVAEIPATDRNRNQELDLVDERVFCWPETSLAAKTAQKAPARPLLSRRGILYIVSFQDLVGEKYSAVGEKISYEKDRPYRLEGNDKSVRYDNLQPCSILRECLACAASSLDHI